jgi:hypothetical protein
MQRGAIAWCEAGDIFDIIKEKYKNAENIGDIDVTIPSEYVNLLWKSEKELVLHNNPSINLSDDIRNKLVDVVNKVNARKTQSKSIMDVNIQ